MFLEDLPNLKRKNEPQENCKKRSLLEEFQMLQKKVKGTFESKHIRGIEVFTDRHCLFTCFFANNFLFTCLYNKSPTMC